MSVIGDMLRMLYSVTCILWTPWDQQLSCADYQGVLIFQVNLYDEAPFGTITLCVDYAGVLDFQVS